MYKDHGEITMRVTRSKMITDILFAQSDEEVQRCVEAAFQYLEQHNTGSHLLKTFIDTSLQELAGFSPMQEEALQWSNIKMARIFFFRRKQTLENVQT